MLLLVFFNALVGIASEPLPLAPFTCQSPSGVIFSDDYQPKGLQSLTSHSPSLDSILWLGVGNQNINMCRLSWQKTRAILTVRDWLLLLRSGVTWPLTARSSWFVRKAVAGHKWRKEGRKVGREGGRKQALVASRGEIACFERVAAGLGRIKECV